MVNLGFNVDASQLTRASTGLDRLSTSSSRAAGDVKRAEGAIAGSFSRIKLAIASVAGLAAGFGLSKFVAAADTYREMSNTLMVLGSSSGEAADKIGELADMAARTRTPLAATVDLYQRTSIAARELGASQDEVLRFTENVGLALAQQGGSAQSAAGALTQLGQALAGGTVRAEEFNSILEGAFPLALAAAKGIDGAAGSVGRLRQMVVAGEVSSREFFAAILSQSDALEAAFGRTVPTVGQAMQVLKDSTVLAIGAFNEASGASTGLANAIMAVARGINAVGGYLATHIDMVQRLTSYVAAAAVAYGTTLVVAFGAAAVAAIRAAGAMAMLSRAMILTGWGAVVVMLGEVINQLRTLAAGVGGFGPLMTHFGAIFSEAAGRVGDAFMAGAKHADAFRLGVVAAAAGAAAGLVENVLRGVNAAVGAFVGAVSAIGAAWSTLPAVVGAGVQAAVNGVIGAVEAMVNAAVSGINTVLQSVNGLLAKAGMEGFGELGKVAIERFSGDFGAAATNAGGKIGAAFGDAMGKEYVSSGWTDSLKSVAGSYQDAAASATEAGQAYGRMASAQLTSVAALRTAYQQGKAEMDAMAASAVTATAAVAGLSEAAGSGGGKGGKGGGKGKAGKPEKDLLAELNAELDHRKSLIGIYDEEAARLEAMKAVYDQLGDTAKNYSLAAIAATADRIVAIDRETQKWEDHKNRISSATDSLAGAWGDFVGGGLRDFKGFAESVLGTFQKMLADMAAEAARAQIGKWVQLLGGGDPLTAALGAAGAPVRSFAGGGYTGNGQRSGGTDGRGGFAAILHPRETVIDHTKQQGIGGGSVNVHVTVGMDESGNLQVRRIAQEESAAVGAKLGKALPAQVQMANARPRRRN